MLRTESWAVPKDLVDHDSLLGILGKPETVPRRMPETKEAQRPENRLWNKEGLAPLHLHLPEPHSIISDSGSKFQSELTCSLFFFFFNLSLNNTFEKQSAIMFFANEGSP